MSFQLRLTRKAALDIAEKYTWMVEHISATAADRWRADLESAIRKLATTARSCPEAPEAQLVGSEIRQLLYRRRKSVYRILFRIRDDAVEVLRVRHARQDLLGEDDL
jgi:plasmid stabilization system protein ParE